MKHIRFAIYRFKWLFAKHLFLKKPVHVDLELSSMCNLKCTFCYHGQKQIPFRLGKMKRKTAMTALIQARDIKAQALKFNFRGEPTLNKDFKEILQASKKMAKGSIFQERIVNTNMQFDSSRDDIFEGLLAATKVKISLDTFRPEIYKKMRPGKESSHERIIFNINILLNDPDRPKGHKVVLQFVKTELNKDEDFEVEAKKLFKKEVEISVRDMVGGRNNNSESPKLERQACNQAFARALVLFDGSIQICCPDIKSKLIVGHVDKEGIKNSFNSEKAKSIRRLVKNHDAFLFQPCAKCSSFESYKGWERNWRS